MTLANLHKIAVETHAEIQCWDRPTLVAFNLAKIRLGLESKGLLASTEDA